jgi:hypothetical protein
MADGINLAQQGTLPPELYAQQQALNRQQQMAAMLMQQGTQQPQGQMVSGRYVPTSFFQNLQPVANMLAGAYLAKQGDTKAAALAEELRKGRSAAEESIINKMTGTPAIPAIEGGIQGPNGQMTKETTADMYGAGMELNPQYKQVAAMAGKAATSPDLSAALREIRTNQYGAGKEYTPTILKQMMPEDTSDYKNFLKVKAEGFPGTFNQYQDVEANRKRPVTNVSVNTGQHGFDNALKLRSDFRNEPVYKGFEETKAAKNQIDQAATMATPAGDLAAATKIMKILDPGSVVRESELGMAMAATGVEDRVRNYANMVIDGTKLTPNQRKDFVELSNKLYNASAEQFNQKRGEYAGIAERNKLDVEAAVGAPAKIKSKELAPQDQQALEWANANSKDPRAAQIKKRLGQ